MSWHIINQVLGWAAIDPVFRQRLQEDPLAALEDRGFILLPEELEMFARFRLLPFSQFCQRLQEELAPGEEY